MKITERTSKSTQGWCSEREHLVKFTSLLLQPSTTRPHITHRANKNMEKQLQCQNIVPLLGKNYFECFKRPVV